MLFGYSWPTSRAMTAISGPGNENTAQIVKLVLSALLCRRRDPRITNPRVFVKSGRRDSDRAHARSASVRLHSVGSSSLNIVSWCAPVLRHHPGLGRPHVYVTMARRGRTVAA